MAAGRRPEGCAGAESVRRGSPRGRRPAYAPEAAMLRGAALMPGRPRAGGLVPGAGAAGSLGARPEGRRLRAAPAAVLTLPPSGRPGLASRACPQGPPRLRLRGSAPRHLHPRPLRRGSENPRPGRWPAPRTASASPSAPGREEDGGCALRAPTARETSQVLPPQKGSPRWRGC